MDEIPAVFAQSHGAIGFTPGEGMERSVWLFYGSLSTQRWTNEKIKFNGPLWRQSDIVLCTNTFPVPRSSLKAPIFCLVRRPPLSRWLEAICRKHLRKCSSQGKTQYYYASHTQLHVWLFGRASLSLMANPAYIFLSQCNQPAECACVSFKRR